MRRKISRLLLFATILAILAGCAHDPAPEQKTVTPETEVTGSEQNAALEQQSAGEAIQLSFSKKTGIEELKQYEGKTVTINGYPGLTSPEDGCFMFIMNIPHHSHPFYEDNTQILADTLEAYPKDGEKLEYTPMAVSATGTLVFSDPADPFTDEYGNVVPYRLINATITEIEAESAPEKIRDWQQLCDTGVIDQMYSFYDYLWLTVAWCDYYIPGHSHEDGSFEPGYYMFPGDYLQCVEEKYPFVTETYIPDLASWIDQLPSGTWIDKLKVNFEDCLQLYRNAADAFNNEAWTTEDRYWEEIGTEETKYFLNDGEIFKAEYGKLWGDFCDILDSFEL